MTLSDCRQLSLLWLSLLDERRKFLDFIRLPTIIITMIIIIRRKTKVSWLYQIADNGPLLITRDSLHLINTFVPTFLCFCKQIWCCYSLFLCLSQVFFVFANKYDVVTVCFHVCPEFSLSLQKKYVDLQFVFMSVPGFLCFARNIMLLQFFLMFAPRFLCFAKNYVVSAISSYVCPKIPLFLQKICCFCNFLLCLSQVFEKTYYVDVICFISILHWQIF